VADGDIQATAEELRAKYPGLSEQAIQLLLQRQVQTGLNPIFEEHPRYQGYVYSDPASDIFLKKEGDLSALLHELTHIYDFNTGTRSEGEAFARAMGSQFKTAQESFSADQILTGFGLPTPGYLTPRTELMNLSPAEFGQKLFESQPDPLEKFAESLVLANADIRNISPSLMPFLSGMTAPSASPWEQIEAQFQKLPPKKKLSPKLPSARPSFPKSQMPQMLARVQKLKRRGVTRTKTTPFEKIARGLQEF